MSRRLIGGSVMNSEPFVRAARAPVGTNVSFKLSEPGKVRFTIDRSTSGRTVGGRCVKASSSNRGRARCKRWVAKARRTSASRLQVLGAAAGIGALATVVGGATLWIRFDALRLPADQSVALLPERLLLIIGIHAIAATVALGAFITVLFVLISPRRAPGQR